jgi:hypothetical protein
MSAWSPELRGALQAVLSEYACAVCPSCDRALDEEDVSFGCGETEAGTGFFTVEVSCSVCGHELRSGGGWGGVDSADDWPNFLSAGLAETAE